MSKHFLTGTDFASLFTFYNQVNDCDADGYTVPKDDMQRLAEIGCVAHKGFGRYEVTMFGEYVIELEFGQKPKLPIRTRADYNAMSAKRASLPGAGEHGT